MNSHLAILHSYLRTLWLAARFTTPEQVAGWQSAQVARHLHTILPLSAFYQEHRAGLPPEKWQEWPTIDKAAMMANFDTLNTAGIKLDEAMAVALASEHSRDFTPTLRGLTVGLSSGTSGHRGLFVASARERNLWAGAALAKLLPAPMWRAQRVALFLRANSNLYTTLRSRRIHFQFFDLLTPLEEQYLPLQRLNPTILIAPPSVLRALARATGSGVLALTPVKIISVAEVLDPLDEAILRRHLHLPIHQVYQATEGFIASTCHHGTLHLHEELLVVQKEYIDPAARKFIPIITDFHRHSQPIIRYRLNDILTERIAPCPCGSPFTAIERIEGRSDDLFYLPAASGSGWVRIFPDFVRRALLLATGEASEQLTEYAVRQIGSSQLEIALDAPDPLLITLPQPIAEELQRLCTHVGAHMPTLHFTTYSPPSPGRKLKRIERIIPAPAGELD
jgi:putative adenylate-forming enzyme